MKNTFSWKRFWKAFIISLPIILIIDIIYDLLFKDFSWKELFSPENLVFKILAAIVGSFFFATFRSEDTT